MSVKYKVLEALSQRQLEKRVDRLINGDWELVGGVTTYVLGGTTCFAQAVVRYGPEEVESVL